MQNPTPNTCDPTPNTHHLSPDRQHPSPRKGIGGPKTAEGKAKSKLNSMKHGLYARSRDGLAAVARQVGASFEDVHQRMLEVYRPADYVEETLVRRAARSAWRLLITETLENNSLVRRTGGLKRRLAPGQDEIIKRERLIELQFHRALAALARKREEDVFAGDELDFGFFARSARAQNEPEFDPSESELSLVQNPNETL